MKLGLSYIVYRLINLDKISISNLLLFS